MAYGLSVIIPEVSEKIRGWSDRDPLLALFMNPEMWVNDAAKAAESWRQMSLGGFHAELRPDQMVELDIKNLSVNAP